MRKQKTKNTPERKILFLSLLFVCMVGIYALGCYPTYTGMKIKVMHQLYSELQQMELADLDDDDMETLNEFQKEKFEVMVVNEAFEQIYTTRTVVSQDYINKHIANKTEYFNEKATIERRKMESRQVLFLRGKIIQGEHIYYVYIKKDVQSGLDIIEGTIWYFVVCLALVTLFCYLWMKKEGKEAICYGMGDGLEAVERASEVGKNIVVSAAALEVAKYLEKTFGTPYEIGYPLVDELVSDLDYNGKKVLVVQQQVMGTAIREEILKQAPDAQVTVASWFMMKPELRQEGDLHLRDEDDYVELVEKGGFDVIYADHCMERMTPKFAGIFVDTVHFAVSGRLA